MELLPSALLCDHVIKVSDYAIDAYFALLETASFLTCYTQGINSYMYAVLKFQGLVKIVLLAPIFFCGPVFSG